VKEPVIVPRADHAISRRDIDSDALKVLYRLNQQGYTAYLVGGSVRDLSLGRRPKDFDIGTDAHPYQIKKLFRNCWIIGRRFRLAHVKFGLKTIEVATFRKNVVDMPVEAEAELDKERERTPAPEARSGRPGAAQLQRDNTFGTPEEDAFRRDFTVNGLFYNIADQSIIDYVGGLGDLERRVLRSIGDPRVRFVEDPVRMLRAAVLGARLGFDLDELVVEATAEHRQLITTASPARLMEEYYKILRSGYAEASFRALSRLRLLELMTPELASPPDSIWDSLARLDSYRQRFPSAPPELTNAILIGGLLEPLGVLERGPGEDGRKPDTRRITLGMMPIARRDVERLQHISQMTPRLVEPELPPRLARSLPNRPAFHDALVWLEVFDDAPDTLDRWRQARSQKSADGAEPAAAEGGRPRRRRRRRRRRSPGGPRSDGSDGASGSGGARSGSTGGGKSGGPGGGGK
jgi:poly(A) polymerase